MQGITHPPRVGRRGERPGELTIALADGASPLVAPSEAMRRATPAQAPGAPAYRPDRPPCRRDPGVVRRPGLLVSFIRHAAIRLRTESGKFRQLQGLGAARFGLIDRSVVRCAVLARSRSFRRGLVSERQGHPSKPDPLDLVEVDLVASAVVELARIGRIAAGDGPDMLHGTGDLALGSDGLAAPKD
jgi:hypothetical protein